MGGGKRRSEGGGGGGGRKKWYGGKEKARSGGSLQSGLRGFIVTCGGPEKPALIEAYRLLQEQRDLLNPTPATQDGEEEASGEPEEEEDNEEDIMESLKKECADIKDQDHKDKRIFMQHMTKVDKVMFVGCRDATLDLPTLALSIMRRAAESPTPLSRFILRLLPISATCPAFPAEVRKTLAAILTPLLSTTTTIAASSTTTTDLVDPLPIGPSYALHFKGRMNQDFERPEALSALDDVIEALSPASRANLSNPDLLVIIEVIKGVALLGYARHFADHKKYNLVELGK